VGGRRKQHNAKRPDTYTGGRRVVACCARSDTREAAAGGGRRVVVMEACGGAGSEQAEERWCWTIAGKGCGPASQSARCTDAGLGAGPSGLATSLHTQASASAHRHLAVACAKPRRCSCSRDGSWGRDEMAGLRSLPEQRSRRPSPLARLYPGSLLLTLWRDARPALALALAGRSTAERAPAPAPWARQPKMPLNALISPNLLAIGALMCFMRAACILAS
jgi:hypothetical protein